MTGSLSVMLTCVGDQHLGITWTKNNSFEDLDFVYDLVLLSPMRPVVQKKDRLTTRHCCLHVRFNWSNSQMKIIDFTIKTTEIKLNYQVLEKVKTITYLGRNMAKNRDVANEISTCIARSQMPSVHCQIQSDHKN